MSDETVFVYVGRAPECGCIRVVMTDKPEYAADNAKSIARIVKDGYHVERITLASFRAEPFDCKRDAAACPNPRNKRRAKQGTLV